MYRHIMYSNVKWDRRILHCLILIFHFAIVFNLLYSFFCPGLNFYNLSVLTLNLGGSETKGRKTVELQV